MNINKLDVARNRLAQAKEAAARKKALKRANRHNAHGHIKRTANESRGKAESIVLLNGQGRVIGRFQREINGRVAIYDAKGLVVARELNGITIDRTGKLVGRGAQGLVALGKALARSRSDVEFFRLVSPTP